MGLSNDGGWLKKMIVRKNGDIDKELDVMKKVKKE